MIDRLLASGVVAAYVVVVTFAITAPHRIASEIRALTPEEYGSASVSGRLVDEEGRGVAGVTVMVGFGSGPWYHRNVITGQLGEFRVADIPEGRVELRPLGDLGALTLARSNVQADASRALHEPVLVRLVRSVSITGSLIDEAGTPVTDCRVGFDAFPDWTVSPDKTGSFELAGLSPEVDYDLEVGTFSRRWAVTSRRGVRGGTKDVQIVMKPRVSRASQPATRSDKEEK